MLKPNKKPWRERLADHPDLPWIGWIGSFVLWAVMCAAVVAIIWLVK